MNHGKRGRVVVALGDGWQAHSHLLAWADMLGTVEVAGRVGALIRRHSDGAYCRSIRGHLMALPATKVEAAILAAGGRVG